MAYSFTDFKNETKKIEEWFAKELTQIHSGRATPVFLDSITIESYGSKMALPHVATISIEDPRTLRVSPWDKGNIKEIEHAIVAANLGVGTAVDDSGLRVTFPALTTERRGELLKLAKQKMEDARIKVRNVREDTWNKIQKAEKEGVVGDD